MVNLLRNQVAQWEMMGLVVSPTLRKQVLAATSDFARSASDGSLGKIFFSLAAINLVLVWGWLIHCAARLDFLRLAAGLLAGTAIIGGLLFLTPAHCSRSPDLTKVGTGFEIPSGQHPVR